MLLYFRFYICNGGKFMTLTIFDCKHTAKNILLYGLCLKSYNIIDFDKFLPNRFCSCCRSVFLFIRSLRLSLPRNSLRSSRENDCVQCLSSCTFPSLSFLSGLSLYWNNILIENSFCVVLWKPERVKLLRKSKRRLHWNLPFSETISRVSLK